MEVAGYVKRTRRCRGINEGKKREDDDKGGSHGLASPPWRPDGRDGHYAFEVGENLTPRYQIIGELGEGTFARVLDCWDRESQENVAIKVVRSVWEYNAAAMLEIDVLRTLAKHDENGLRGCLQLKNWFHHGSHVCIVCEKLGPSLHDVLRKNDLRPFSVDVVRELGRQVLEAVAFIHDLKLTHTDLKPHNILLVSSENDQNSLDPEKPYNCTLTSSGIKLVDFGGATFEKQPHGSVVSTRAYRAPEVIMGLGWSYPCDLWGVGCILVELCSGNALFQTHENLEHLAMMEQVLGPIPESMMERAGECVREYLRNGREQSAGAVGSLPRLRNLVTQHVDHSSGALIELLHGLLNFDPDRRLSAKQALKHHFFTGK